jgi:hypothetical protein
VSLDLVLQQTVAICLSITVDGGDFIP